MTASIGIWKDRTTVNGGVVYRWSADDGAGATGYVLLDTGTGAARPCAADGQPLGDLRLGLDAQPQLTGSAAGVDTRLFVRVAGAVLRAFAASGAPPETAHKTYF